MANGNRTLRKGAAVSFPAPWSLLHLPTSSHHCFKSPKVSQLCALVTQTHDLDLPPDAIPLPLSIMFSLRYLGRRQDPRLPPHTQARLLSGIQMLSQRSGKGPAVVIKVLNRLTGGSALVGLT